MYSAPHQASAPMNGMSGEVIDGSGTINPAALNTAGMGFGCLFMFLLSVSSLRAFRANMLCSPDNLQISRTMA